MAVSPDADTISDDAAGVDPNTRGDNRLDSNDDMGADLGGRIDRRSGRDAGAAMDGRLDRSLWVKER